MSSNQPSPTLYVNNLNDKIQKEELRSQLYSLFSTYGKLIDVVATKTPKMRGQAFCVFSDLAGATSAMRACEGMLFYDKPMVCALQHSLAKTQWPLTLFQHIDYAKSKSYATNLKEDPTFIPPKSAHAPTVNGVSSIALADKRPRDEDGIDSGPPAKKERPGIDSDDEEMEMDED